MIQYYIKPCIKVHNIGIDAHLLTTSNNPFVNTNISVVPLVEDNEDTELVGEEDEDNEIPESSAAANQI